MTHFRGEGIKATGPKYIGEACEVEEEERKRQRCHAIDKTVKLHGRCSEEALRQTMPFLGSRSKARRPLSLSDFDMVI
jgi:hypothetical protein